MRCVVQHDATTQLELTEFFIGCIYSNSPLDRKNLVRQSPPSVQDPHALPQPPPGLEQPVPLPELAAYSHLLTNVNSSSSQPYPAAACQYHSCGNTPCTHRSQRQKECQYRPSGNP